MYNIEWFQESIQNGMPFGFVIVGAHGKKGDVMLMFKGSPSQFKKTFEKIRDKYVEWSKVAEENHVTSFEKEIAPRLRFSVAWDSSCEYNYFEGGIEKNFSFVVSNGKSYLCLVGNATDAGMTETYSLFFSNIEEINTFIEKFQIDENGNFIQQDELFK